MKKLLWLSIVVATGLYICGPIVDPDLWWHLTVGRWIISNHEIPYVDYWNMFSVGKPWQAYSWSNEVVLALVDAAWGIKGLLTLKMLLAVLIAASLFYSLGRISRDWFFGGVLGMYATASCFNHFTLRPQSLVWALMAFLLCTADLIDREGLTRRRGLTLFVIMLIWANTHLTAALGIALSVAWIWRRGQAALAAKVGALCFLGTLFTPYFGGEWLVLFAKSSHPFRHSSIAEFMPATILQYSTAFLVILGALFAVFLHKQPRLLPPMRLIAGLFLALAGLSVVKFLPWAVIYMCACVGSIWSYATQDRGALGGLAEGIERLRKAFTWLPEAGLTFVCLCAAFVSWKRVWEVPLSLEHTPVSAVDFILERNLPHPVLNDFGKGGYLMYRFSDSAGKLDHLVPIDGRTNVNDPKAWEGFRAAFNGRNNWRDYINLVNPKTILWNTQSALSSILLAGDEWCEVYRSPHPGVYAVYLKKEYWQTRKEELPSPNCAGKPGNHPG